MSKIIYFVRYSNAAASAFHWTNVDNKIGVVAMASALHERNKRDGGDRKIDKILEVEVLEEYEIKPVFGLHRTKKIKRKEGDPKPGFRGNDGRTPCLDIRCLNSDRHYTDECPHKDEDINIPCEDKLCSVNGPHTVYNCHKIPRCHNPNCEGEQGTHWAKDCPDRVFSNYPNNDNGVHEMKDCPYQPMTHLCDVCNPSESESPKTTGMEWKDIDTTPRVCTNSQCAMPAFSREEKCKRSSCDKYK